MKKQVLSFVVGAAALLALGATGYAQDARQPTGSELAATLAKVRIASGVIAVGRADKDPMMLVVGAKLLSGLGPGADAEGKEEGDASQAFHVSQILDEAKALAGDNTYLLDEIAALASGPERNARGDRYCNWHEVCGYSITDPFACDEVYVCD